MVDDVDEPDERRSNEFLFARVEALPYRSWNVPNAKESATIGASREGQYSDELVLAECCSRLQIDWHSFGFQAYLL